VQKYKNTAISPIFSAKTIGRRTNDVLSRLRFFGTKNNKFKHQTKLAAENVRLLLFLITFAAVYDKGVPEKAEIIPL
jgi:hypothetical protein